MTTASSWQLPKNLLAQSISIMQPHGAMGNEGLALWFGRDHGEQLQVTHVVETIGSGFHTTPLFMSLSLRAMSVLTDMADQLNVYLIGQIHSHPKNFIDLSDLDKIHGIRIPGYLSLVCPHYAQKQLDGILECGIHVFENGQYRRMPAHEASRRLLLCDTTVTKLRCEVPL